MVWHVATQMTSFVQERALQWCHMRFKASKITWNWIICANQQRKYQRSGPRLNIKTVFTKYGDYHVKDKTVGETVLSLTWGSLFWWDGIFILRRPPGLYWLYVGESTDYHWISLNNLKSLPYYVSLFVSLLSHFWLIHFFHLHLLYQPYLGLCQAQCVQSLQRQPMSAIAITACEVQVSAAESQTVPTVATGV